MTTLSTIIVTHDSLPAVARSVPAIAGQMRDGDELIVVDNDSADGTAGAVRELSPAARVIETGANPGFGAACNRGATEATGELLLFLNPDAVPAPGFRDAIERPHADGRGWAAWQGLVTAEGGRVVNTRGGVAHFTAIAWAGGAGEPLGADDDGGGPPREPAFVSGACLAIERERFLELGGFAEGFFLYHEDVELSFRLRLAGGRLGVESSARVDHDYEFVKGSGKWRQLERNRWATVIRTYPAALLVLIAPGLLATELALLAIAARGGWLRDKLAATADTLRSLPRLVGERRRVQRLRQVRAADFAVALSADLDSAYLGAAARSRPLRSVLRAYWSAVSALLGHPSASTPALRRLQAGAGRRPRSGE